MIRPGVPSALLSAGWILVIACAGCSQRIPKGALAMTEPTIQVRERTTRRFDTKEELKILSASAALLQDLGFTIDESELPVGLIVASKDRSAVEGGQVAAKVAVMVLFRRNMAIDKEQKFRASLVTRPSGDHIIVRVTFQRVVWNENGQVSKLERLDDPADYQEFFDKLAKAVFLEAHKV